MKLRKKSVLIQRGSMSRSELLHLLRHGSDVYLYLKHVRQGKQFIFLCSLRTFN
jgi:hypothetical protein